MALNSQYQMTWTVALMEGTIPVSPSDTILFCTFFKVYRRGRPPISHVGLVLQDQEVCRG